MILGERREKREQGENTKTMRKLIFFCIILASLIIINNLALSIYSLWQKQDLLITAQKQLKSEKKTNQTLKKQLVKVQSPHFLEEQARDRLLMVKPGEQLVVLPQISFEPTPSPQKKTQQKPNWQKWYDLFF